MVVTRGKMTFAKEKRKKVTHPHGDEGPAVLTLCEKKEKRLFDPAGTESKERENWNWTRLGSTCTLCSFPLCDKQFFV